MLQAWLAALSFFWPCIHHSTHLCTTRVVLIVRKPHIYIYTGVIIFARPTIGSVARVHTYQNRFALHWCVTSGLQHKFYIKYHNGNVNNLQQMSFCSVSFFTLLLKFHKSTTCEQWAFDQCKLIIYGLLVMDFI